MTAPWAKWDGRSAPYPVAAHALDTAAVALVLYRDVLSAPVQDLLVRALRWSAETADRRFAWVAGAHDLGKVGPLHQGQLLTVAAGRFAAFVSGLGLPRPSPKWLARAVALPSQARVLLRHEALSAYMLERDGLPSWACAAVSGHHGRFQPDVDRIPRVVDEHYRFLDESGGWRAEQDAVLIALDAAVRRPTAADDPEDAGPAVPLLTGLVCLADWLASDATFLADHECLQLLAEPQKYFARRVADAEAWVERSIGLPVRRPGSFGQVFPFEPARPVQQWAVDAEHGPGLAIVAVPMGEGKTEAGLWRHAAGGGCRDGLIWGLPTTAMADAMLGRVLRFYTGTDGFAHLAHGRALLNAFYQQSPAIPAGVCDDEEMQSGLRPGSWFRGRHRALTAPVGVMTCDQVLAVGVSHKFAPVRLAALAGKHVVLDEVHTYDPYQDRLLCRVLGWLGFVRARVTLLTATLPTRRLREYVAAYQAGWNRSGENAAPPVLPGLYPAVTSVDDRGVVQQRLAAHRSYVHRLHVHRLAAARFDTATVELVLQARAGDRQARLGVIVNRVDRAVAVAIELAERGEPVLLLQGRMTFGQREDAVRQLLQRTGPTAQAGPVTVVATQLAEASLDIDLDVVFTDLAPMPSLLQRAGRQWRHSIPIAGGWIHPLAVAGRHGDPVLHILVPTAASGDLDAGAHYPYSRAEIRRTWRATEALAGGDRDRLRIPEDVQGAVDAADVRLEDLDTDDWSDTNPELAHLLAAGAASAAAHRVGVDVASVARDWRTAMRAGDGWAGVPALAALTRGELWREEAVTRLRDADTVQVLLYDPTGRHQIAWPGGVAELLDVRGGRTLIEALRHVIPVSGRLASRLRAAAGQPPHGWHPATLLNDVLPLPVGSLPAGYRFDEYGLHNHPTGGQP
ncbi:CRISPR-associated helicase Cas3' [Dactylosporangium aurantiacum]|uniref:CRISPR-associated helicase Cas3 n=1 Tax=Dactylosporangium aurantiacum TaxID=35754 RepID=A0A9Q9IKK0_9ACTN|nr:CRISPR-associated helicase Cas3' [Dactylosporangium aurantiacum]MDG6108819.1 CRISPR-associated helicase Cas3' [Dactylosporangium aurantiacum]UWZ55775.1 CRISPR-associated helicase Cas3' [Dactylosporangium aurantiacum]